MGIIDNDYNFYHSLTISVIALIQWEAYQPDLTYSTKNSTYLLHRNKNKNDKIFAFFKTLFATLLFICCVLIHVMKKNHKINMLSNNMNNTCGKKKFMRKKIDTLSRSNSRL